MNHKRTYETITLFQCLRKPTPEAASGDTETDDRNINIIETTEKEPDKADTILRGTENEADAIVALPGTSKHRYVYVDALLSTVSMGRDT